LTGSTRSWRSRWHIPVRTPVDRRRDRLKFLSIFVDQIQIGKGNDAYVVGPTGRLLATRTPSAVWGAISRSFRRWPPWSTRNRADPPSERTSTDVRS
jgi:hypothetical protein